jgi:holo-[acyl-carrier protein] synthase
MIFGVGTDIVVIARLDDLYRKHGERALAKILAPGERDDCRASADPGRFLAKRFAAKEAFGKALGTGLRAPAVLSAITVVHDALGRPGFQFAPELAALMTERDLIAHLSISDETDSALAFVVVERTP